MEQVKLLEVKSEIAAGTRGASLGVDALKTACLDKGSDYFALYDAEEVENVNDILFDTNKFPHAKFIDGVLVMEERVCEATAEALAGKYFPIVLAGDHSTSAGTICGIKKTYPDKRLGVIWIDAHADLHTPFTTPSGNMHGMPLAMVSAIDNQACQVNQPGVETLMYWEKLKHVGLPGPKIYLSDVVFIAVRDTEEPEKHLMEQYGIKNFSPAEIREKGVKKVVEETCFLLDHCEMIYVSFDVDSMDSKYSEGTGTPVADGLTVQEASDFNTLLIKNKKVCVWEMVEVNPTLDTLNSMAETAFDILEATTQALLERDIRLEKAV